MWSILLREYIGFCGLRYIEGTEKLKFCSVFYWSFQGKGLGFEAASAVIRESGLTDCIYGRCDKANTASIRLLEKLGMRLEEKTFVDSRPPLVYPRQAKAPAPLCSAYR